MLIVAAFAAGMLVATTAQASEKVPAVEIERDTRSPEQRRLDYASALQRLMLRSGRDAYIQTSGPRASTLEITYVMMNRPAVFHIVNETDMPEQWLKHGFRRVILRDGYGSGWLYDVGARRFVSM